MEYAGIKKKNHNGQNVSRGKEIRMNRIVIKRKDKGRKKKQTVQKGGKLAWLDINKYERQKETVATDAFIGQREGEMGKMNMIRSMERKTKHMNVIKAAECSTGQHKWLESGPE